MFFQVQKFFLRGFELQLVPSFAFKLIVSDDKLIKKIVNTSRDDSSDEDAGILLLVLVEAAVDEGEAEASGASLDGDGTRP